LHSIISRYFNSVNGVLYITDTLPSDPAFEMVLAIFGFKKRQKLLAFAGQNEFLSALVAVRELMPILNWRELVMITACIEATIPFRAGEGKIEELKTKIMQVNDKMKLGFDDSVVNRA